MNKFEIAQKIYIENQKIIENNDLNGGFNYLLEHLGSDGRFTNHDFKIESNDFEEGMKIWKDNIYIRVIREGKIYKDKIFKIGDISTNNYLSDGLSFTDTFSNGEHNRTSNDLTELNSMLSKYLNKPMMRQLHESRKNSIEMYFEGIKSIINKIYNEDYQSNVRELILYLACVFYAIPETFLSFSSDRETFNDLTQDNLISKFSKLNYRRTDDLTKKLIYGKPSDNSKEYTINDVYKYLEEYRIPTMTMNRFMNNEVNRPSFDFLIRISYALRLSVYEFETIVNKFGYSFNEVDSVMKEHITLKKIVGKALPYIVYKNFKKSKFNYKTSFNKKSFIERVNKEEIMW